MGIIKKTIALASILAASYAIGATGACDYMMQKSRASDDVQQKVVEANNTYRRTIDNMVEKAVDKAIYYSRR